MDFHQGDMLIRINVPDRATLLTEIGARLGEGRGFALARLNLDHLDRLCRNALFRTAYDAQDLR